MLKKKMTLWIALILAMLLRCSNFQIWKTN